MKELVTIIVGIISVLFLCGVMLTAGYQAGRIESIKELHNFILINDGYDFAKGDVEYEFYKMKAKDRAEKIASEKLLEVLQGTSPVIKDKET